MDSLDPLRVKVSSCSMRRDFIRIRDGGFTIWLHPFGMLDPQVVVNLLPEFGVSVDLVRHDHWLGCD